MTRSVPLMLLSAALWLAFIALVVAIMWTLLRACGLVLPGYGTLHHVGFAYCAARPASAPARTPDQMTGDLRELMRSLELRLLQMRAACLAEAPPRPSPQTPGPEIAKPQAPAEPPKPELKLPPKPTNDLAFLKGCWRTDPFQHMPTDAKGVSTYCFDEGGAGRLEYKHVDKPDYSCRPQAKAGFEGQVLRIRDSDTQCSDGTKWYADVLDCRRGADDVAECSGESTTPQGKHSWTVKLRRVQ